MALAGNDEHETAGKGKSGGPPLYFVVQPLPPAAPGTLGCLSHLQLPRLLCTRPLLLKKKSQLPLSRRLAPSYEHAPQLHAPPQREPAPAAAFGCRFDSHSTGHSIASAVFQNPTPFHIAGCCCVQRQNDEDYIPLAAAAAAAGRRPLLAVHRLPLSLFPPPSTVLNHAHWDSQQQVQQQQ